MTRRLLKNPHIDPQKIKYLYDSFNSEYPTKF